MHFLQCSPAGSVICAITLVAGTSLTARYQQAFQAMGCDVTAVAGDTAFQAGIRSAESALELVAEPAREAAKDMRDNLRAVLP